MILLSPLAKKLHIKPHTRTLLLRAPDGSRALLDPLPEGASVFTTGKGPFDLVLFFAHKTKDLEGGARKAIGALRSGGALWIAFPKKRSKIASDLSRDAGWDVIHQAGYRGVAQIGIDKTWAALRFKLEVAIPRKVGSFAAPAAKRKAALANKIELIAPPADLAQALSNHHVARAKWMTLAPSHHNEYIRWIEEVKRPETRARRLTQTIELLAAGVRDRNKKYARR